MLPRQIWGRGLLGGALCGMLLICWASSRHESACIAYAGESPPPRLAQALPEVPQAQGWCQYLGERTFPCGLVAGAGRVCMLAGGMLHLFDGETGAPLWQAPCGTLGYWDTPYNWLQALPLLSADRVYYQDRTTLRCVDASSGAALWAAPDRLPVALAPGDGLWALVRDRQLEEHEEGLHFFSAVELLDGRDGAVRRHIDTGPLLGWAGETASNGRLAVKAAEAVLVLDVDGGQLSLPSAHAYLGADLAFTRHGLVVYEHFTHAGAMLTMQLRVPDPTEVPGPQSPPSVDDTAMRPPRLSGPPVREPPLPLSLYDLADGRVLWRIKDLEAGDSMSWRNEAGTSVSDEFIVAFQRAGFSVYETASGRRLANVESSYVAYFTPYLKLASGQHVFWSAPGGSRTMGLYAYDPRRDSFHRLMDTKGMEVPEAAVDAGRLYLLINYGAGSEETYRSSGEASTYGYLLALRLDQDGRLEPGHVAQLSAPTPPEDVYSRFLSSADPLTDAALYQELLNAGDEVFKAALDNVSDLPVPQLRVLAYWVLARDKQLERYNIHYPAAVLSLLAALRRQAEPRLSPVILGWLADSELKPLHSRLRGVLALCGDEAALAYLRGYYAPVDGSAAPVLHQPAAPPCTMKPQQTYYMDIGEQAHQQTAWAEAKGAGGARYVAYTASGLVSERDICLAVDANNDGAYEEVLPTRLSDVYQGYSFPGGAYDIDKHGELRLAVDGKKLLLTHHVPIAKYDAERQYTYFEQTRFETTPLTLAELRRDSDRDGLTDLAEKLLFTDPQVADTDGDGLSDLIDPAPNAFALHMGKVERGIARALDYFFADEETAGFAAHWPKPDAAGHPWRAVYFAVSGAGEVSFPPGACAYGVCLWQPSQKEQYAQLLSEFPGFNCADVEWPGAPLDDLRCYQILEGYQENGPSKAELEAWLSANRERFGDGLYEMAINLTWLGKAVLLVDREGELYPVEAYETWIS